MISPSDFTHLLKERGFKYFTGVPCSFFQSAINCIIEDEDLRYTIVPNEGAALALASGHSLGSERSVVMIQNSGLGNLINPLTSLNLIYKIPALIFVSGRAYGVEDEPQHEIMGKAMDKMLRMIDVPCADLPDNQEGCEHALNIALDHLEKNKTPYVFFVRKGTIGKRPLISRERMFEMKRIDAITIIAEHLNGTEAVFATTGKPSRELFAVRDSARNFYMQGSMGHISSLALGYALSRPKERVVALDGDGALLMHAGALSSIGHYAPENLIHLVLDNEAYETTGDQDTTSATTDLAAMALACGYKAAETVKTAKDLRRALNDVSTMKGPVFLRIKINREPTKDIPRITSKYTSHEIAEQFMNSSKKVSS